MYKHSDISSFLFTPVDLHLHTKNAETEREIHKKKWRDTQDREKESGRGGGARKRDIEYITVLYTLRPTLLTLSCQRKNSTVSKQVMNSNQMAPASHTRVVTHS